MSIQELAAFANAGNFMASRSAYNDLIAILDARDDDALRAVYEARIQFVSTLAFNRMIRRGIA